MEENVEYYFENGKYGIYFGSESSSGYKCEGTTIDECVNKAAKYMKGQLRLL